MQRPYRPNSVEKIFTPTNARHANQITRHCEADGILRSVYVYCQEMFSVFVLLALRQETAQPHEEEFGREVGRQRTGLTGA
jgi:hypothetical protein